MATASERDRKEIYERPALYYPYIHIRSEQWLKATLLCAPAVKRIVPDGYAPEDNSTVTKYSRIAGKFGPLLQTVPAYSPAADEAQQRLLRRLQDHEEEILSRYHRSLAPHRDEYWIHTAKFNGSLLNYLLEKELAWPSVDPHGWGHRTWYALHPVLGSAVMTTLGLSLAHEQSYDIVTPSSQFHETLLATDQRDVFDVLIGEPPYSSGLGLKQVARDIGQLVISLSGINYEALRPEEIPELQESKHFGAFQSLIRQAAHDIVIEGDVRDYEPRLKVKSQELVDAWHGVGSDIKEAVKEALFEDALVLSGEGAKMYFQKSGLVELAIAAGIAVGLTTNKVLRAAKKRESSPYQYLTELAESQDNLLQMTFPLGLERVASPA